MKGGNKLDILNKSKKSYLFYVNNAILIFLGYLIYKYQFIDMPLFGLGGSVMILIFISILIFLRRIIKSLTLELNLGISMITGILIFNFLSYWEISGRTIGATYLNIGFFCLIFFTYIITSIVRIPFKNYDQINESERKFFVRQIMLTILLPVFIFGLAFAMLSGLMAYDILKSEPNIAISCPLLKISYMVVFWIVIALLVTFIYLSKIKDDDIRKFLKDERLDVVKYDTGKIKKYFKIIFLSVIFLGSFGEIVRGMWIMWIETILLLYLMSLIIWKIYKHVFLSETRSL